ncbi:MAG: AmmeMemoRadiSam system protein B [Methanobrevibacter sp.]|jgi:AmmeMemoRadiSam system protein B|nr:AmmeMemoRadiSam system protein B [Methanobrevibacter sp.]
MKRTPAVSGLFYESNPDDLAEEIQSCFNNSSLGIGKLPKLGNSRSHIYGAVVPHAGYMYSGAIATHSYYHLVENGFPETFIILCPNHTGDCSSVVSVFNEGKWETPLGSVDIDSEFADVLISNLAIANSDAIGHIREHSCEVHLPFLQYFSNDFKIVPIIISIQDLETSNILAKGIVEVSKNLSRNISIIASTDLSHYVDSKTAKFYDEMVLEDIVNLDENQLIEDVKENNISMCGYGPVATTIIACKLLGANTFELLKYGNSGDSSGDFDRVVGYGSGIFK